jgi:hypothetical protein
VTGRRPRQAGQSWPQPNSGTCQSTRVSIFASLVSEPTACGLESPCRRSIRGASRPRLQYRKTAAACVASDQSSPPHLGPIACLTAEQEHRRRSRHQQRTVDNGARQGGRRGLEVSPGPAPHSDLPAAWATTARACRSGFLAMTSNEYFPSLFMPRQAARLTSRNGIERRNAVEPQHSECRLNLPRH